MNSNPLKLTKTDFKEVDQAAGILARIDAGDAVYFDKVTNEIRRHQPFMLSAMLGYSYDLPPDAFGEVLKLYVLIWEFFKENRTAKKKAVTQAQFESVQQKNVHFIKYLEGESPTSSSFAALVGNDLERLRSKALWTAFLMRFNECQALQDLNPELRSIVLVSLKSMIECFEGLTGLQLPE